MRRTSSKEYTDNQRLKYENSKLKRQIERLRKQLARVDLEEYTNVREALEAQQREDIAFEKQSEKVLIKKRWECHQCARDYLRLVVIDRPDGAFYFRKCPSCDNRTRLKPFTADVKGPTVE